MINTVIADDDIEMLDWLEQIVPWEANGFKIVSRAQSGSEALEVCKELMPDLVITDISMPAISGLDLISELKKIKPDIKTIIITCHEDFNYAQRAVKMEADDYLLKYTLTSQNLTEALKRLREKVKSESAREEQIYLLNKEISSNKMVLEEKYITDIIDGILIMKDEIKNRAEVLKIRYTDKPFRVICTFIDNYEKDIKNCPFSEENLLKFCIMNVAEEIMESEDDIKCYSYGKDKLLMLLSDGSQDVTLKQRTILKIKEFQSAIKNVLKMNMSSCISGVYKDYTDIGKAVNETAVMRDSYFFEGSGMVVTQKKSLTDINVREYIDEIRKDLKPVLDTGDKTLLLNQLDALYKKLETSQYKPSATKKILSKISIDLQVAVKKNESDYIDIRSNTNTYSSLKESFIGVVNDYLETVTESKQQPLRKEIETVLTYIRENLEGNITCESMALMVNMNSSYFSRLFKSEVGVNFSDYLIGRRIEKATKFLEQTGMTIDEITKAVGLEQPSYFYKLYKKVTGKTPGEVRNRK